MDVVEMTLRHGLEARDLRDDAHAGYTPPAPAHVTPL
jgi:hypothetical protein